MPETTLPDRGPCTECGTAYGTCAAMRNGRCCETCLNHYGDTHQDPWFYQAAVVPGS